MRKILFNDKYGLTDAVLEGRKTMTRRLVHQCILDTVNQYREDYYNATLDNISFDDAILNMVTVENMFNNFHYKKGEVVAVAQSYNMICTDFEKLNEVKCMCGRDVTKDKSWTNKMYVKPYLMPHQIRITDIKAEKLQDISEEDSMREGIRDYIIGYGFNGWINKNGELKHTAIAKDAFAYLIDKISGKGTWKRNPYVFAYSFELVK